MTNFDDALWIRPTEDDIIIFGKSPEQTLDDTSSGVARFGGRWRSPSYLRAYRRAAHLLVHSAVAAGELDQLGLPIFYLQRHSSELLIKQLLRWCYDIAEMRQQVNPGLASSWSPSSGMLRRLSNEHNLSQLLSDLKRACGSMGFGDAPLQLTTLVDLLENFENHPTWARYPNSRKTAAQPRQHTDVEVVVPIAKIQETLDAAVEEVLFQPREERPSLESSLYAQWCDLSREVDDSAS